jgi:hypothetical protein
VHELDRSHADQEAKHFDACGLQRHGQAQTSAALFHRRDMECRRVGNCLNVFAAAQVIVCPGNRRELTVV